MLWLDTLHNTLIKKGTSGFERSIHEPHLWRVILTIVRRGHGFVNYCQEHEIDERSESNFLASGRLDSDYNFC